MPQGYRAFKAPDGVTATGTYAVVDIGGSVDRVFAQVVITGTATIEIEASLDNSNYLPVTPDITASTIWELDPGIPYYRVEVKSYSSGTVTVAFGPGEGRMREMQNVSGPIVTVGGPQ